MFLHKSIFLKQLIQKLKRDLQRDFIFFQERRDVVLVKWCVFIHAEFVVRTRVLTMNMIFGIFLGFSPSVNMDCSFFSSIFWNVSKLFLRFLVVCGWFSRNWKKNIFTSEEGPYTILYSLTSQKIFFLFWVRKIWYTKQFNLKPNTPLKKWLPNVEMLQVLENLRQILLCQITELGYVWWMF